MSRAAGSRIWTLERPDAGRLVYRDTGPGQAGPAFVLLHGINMSSAVWASVLDLLGPEHRCIALDFRGHGESALEGPYTAQAYADDVEAVLDAAGIDRAHLVGVSLGGAVACIVALRRPYLAHRVVAFGSAMQVDVADLEQKMGLLRELGVRDYFARTVGGGSTAREDQAVVAELVRQAAHGRPTSVVEEIIRSGLTAELSDLRALPCPALTVNGDRDRVCPPERGTELARIIGAEPRKVEGAGHVLPLEDPAAVARIVLDFCRERRQTRDARA